MAEKGAAAADSSQSQQQHHQSAPPQQHRNQNRGRGNGNGGGGRRLDHHRNDYGAPVNQDGGRPPPRRNFNNQQSYNNRNHHHPRQPNRPKPASGFDHLIKLRKDHAGIKMSGSVHDCNICCSPSDVFGVGECKHHSCMECCLRMRILDENESCPQCRSPIEMLYFVSAPKSWDDFQLPTEEVPHKDSAKYKIKFANSYTVSCYDAYLAHSCQICAKKGDKCEFPTFGALRHHTSITHERTFCPICIEHLNVLSKDRDSYTKAELDRHMKGTSDEIVGQKGHPSCSFCSQRFFDDDHLYRHLRQDHFFCQICDADGGHHFFPKPEKLYEHYRQKHHPCTEPDCLAMGIVFKSDFDLGIHKANEHGGSSSSRNVNIDIQFSGRNLGSRIPRSGGQEREYPSVRQERLSVVPNNDPVPSASSVPTRIVPSAQTQQRAYILPGYQTSTQDFPTLAPGATVPAGSTSMPNWRQEVHDDRRKAEIKKALQLNSGEQFPSLGGGSSRVAPTKTAETFPSLNNSKKPSSSSASAVANTVWGKKPVVQLFKNKPPPPKPVAPETPRRKFEALPDAWPEGIRIRLEAKKNGLPDPGDPEPIPLDPLFKLENAKKEKRKAAKLKSKTVPIFAVANRLEENASIAQPSKFDALSDVGESGSAKKNKGGNKINYSLTTDNVVKIEPVPTLKSVAASIGAKEEEASSREESKPPQNGAKAEQFPPLGNSVFPSLTDIVSGFWNRSTPSSTQPSTPSKKNELSHGPPPGFS